MATYLVTGGAGFIGSHIATALVERGERVRILDDFSTGKRENLSGFGDRVELLAASMVDPDVAHAAVDGVDFVLHEAALPSVPRSIADPIRTNEVNITGTLNLLVAARDAGIRRFVFASSSSVYGNAAALPKAEGMRLDPVSPYAVSKLAGEAYAMAFHRIYGLPTVALRYFNVFGPRQDPNSQYSGVVAKFMAMMLRGETPVIFGDGSQSRDFTYVQNVVEANLAACEADAAVGEVFNVACGERHTVRELFQVVAEATKHGGEPAYQPSRDGDVQHSLAALEKARDLLGYRPSVSWEEGLRRTVDWYRSGADARQTVKGVV